MKRRITTMLAAMLLALSMMALPAAAEDHDHGGLPEHGHIMLLGASWTGAGPTTVLYDYRKCVDMPVTPLQAHHSSIHQGNAAKGLAKGNARGNHLVVPTAPFPMVPWSDCASFEQIVEASGGLPFSFGPPPSP